MGPPGASCKEYKEVLFEHRTSLVLFLVPLSLALLVVFFFLHSALYNGAHPFPDAARTSIRLFEDRTRPGRKWFATEPTYTRRLYARTCMHGGARREHTHEHRRRSLSRSIWPIRVPCTRLATMRPTWHFRPGEESVVVVAVVTGWSSDSFSPIDAAEFDLGTSRVEGIRPSSPRDLLPTWLPVSVRLHFLPLIHGFF